MEGLDVLSSTGGGAILGAIFSYISSARKEAHQERMELLSAKINANKEADTSADKAMQRDLSQVGQRIRQFIVVALVFSFCLAPFVFAWTSIPIAVERTETFGGYFWGIIPEYTRDVIEYAKGFYIPSEFKTAFMAIIGFYFGRSATR